MPEVIPDEPFRNRCLRRAGLHRGMSVNRTLCRIEARIGDTVDTRLAVVGDVLYQPVYSVIGIARLIGVLRRLLVGIVRTDVNELAFRSALPSHVLINEDK